MAVPTALLLLLLAVAPVVYATNYNVEWSQGVDYVKWASGKTFFVGDTLVFSYGGLHSLAEVSKSDYDSCNIGNYIRLSSNGNDVVKLSQPGQRYFLCPTSNHCDEGMKLAITVSSANTPTGDTPTTPSTDAAASNLYNANALVLGASAVFAVLMG
ncbi:PREDICTED: uclacyanin-2-like [Nelumbo nucifera]|uniref:Uclacyanin-2-like n=2 Tax=Nelumbo nucifera TaxID=4432 RepID=A0A1U8A9P6_NELNU|nr:PREDICTED: uclacyanin-2-like [Nelumbo nucifera]DAD47668.1 TPA_asm: hypothetical protein HUJ06_017605 [Nelumbo nucifera]